jgi:hypothetical protein
MSSLVVTVVLNDTMVAIYVNRYYNTTYMSSELKEGSEQSSDNRLCMFNLSIRACGKSDIKAALKNGGASHEA